MSSPEQLIQAIDLCIAEALVALEKDENADITEMHHRIAQLTQAVTHLSPEEGQAYADDLSRILASVNVLETTLSTRRDAILASLQGLQHYKNAASAYAKRVVGKPVNADAEPDANEDSY